MSTHTPQILDEISKLDAPTRVYIGYSWNANYWYRAAGELLDNDKSLAAQRRATMLFCRGEFYDKMAHDAIRQCSWEARADTMMKYHETYQEFRKIKLDTRLLACIIVCDVN